jgi:hypothetical protein
MLAAACSVRIVRPAAEGAPGLLEAPSNAVGAGQRLAVRYFRDGAKRVVLEARRVSPGDGLDLVEVGALGGVEPAPQRSSERAAISVSVPARAVRCARLDPGTRIQLEVVNASEGGVLVRTDLPLGYGDEVALEAGGVEALVRIIRRDPRGPRLAGRFPDEAAGREAYARLTALARGAY